MDEVRVILANLPLSIKGYTIRKDDYYTIVLNDRYSQEQRLETYWHELRHIHNRDFDSDLPAGFIEIQTHKEN